MNTKLLKAGALVAAGGALAGCAQKEAPQRPNVVFILADDLGWGDLGCYGQQLIETPNIDALASRGMRFTQCYSGTTVSAPSRSCLITGTHSGHTAIRGNKPVKGREPGITEGQQELPEGSQTLFHDFRMLGYRTGAFGKWGLGYITTTGNPDRQGVDTFFGYNCQTLAHSYYPDHLWDNDTRILLEDNVPGIPYGQGTYSADLIHQKSLEFMEKAVADGKPFFMWYPTTIPHAELIVPEDEIIARYREKFPDETPWAGQDEGHPRFRLGGYCSVAEPHATFAAMVARLDKYVGELVDKLKELGVYENTIILFASDNGPHLRLQRPLARLQTRPLRGRHPRPDDHRVARAHRPGHGDRLRVLLLGHDAHLPQHPGSGCRPVGDGRHQPAAAAGGPQGTEAA